MKSYIIVTGLAFAFLALAHVARIFLEGWHVASSPVFVFTTLGSVAICIWALYLYKRLPSHALRP